MATINSMDASAYEYLGTILGSVDLFSGGTQTFIFFKGSDEKYYLASVPLCVGAQGNLVRNWFVGSEVFDSQEEAIVSVINTYEGEIRENPFES